MKLDEETANLLSRRLQEEERSARRRGLLLTSVPILTGVVVLVAIVMSVRDARDELEKLDAAKRDVKAELKIKRAELASLRAQAEQGRLLLAQIERKLPEDAKQEIQLLAEGIRKNTAGDYGAAVQAYGEALKLDESNPLAWAWQGEALSRAGDHAAALQSFDRSLALEADLAETHYKRGLALFRSGERDAAVESIQRAFALDDSYQRLAYQDPDFFPIRDYMEREQGKQSASTKNEQELIDEALGFAKDGEFKQAIGFYDSALGQNPNNETVWNWKGYAQYRMEDYAGAVESFDRAIEVKPDFAEAYYNRGLALWRLPDRSAAVASVDRAFELEPSYEQRALQDPQYRGLRKARERVVSAR
jgi:tetratricopeptide (TPR) repeat protein